MMGKQLARTLLTAVVAAWCAHGSILRAQPQSQPEGQPAQPEGQPGEAAGAESQEIVTASGLRYVDLEVGSGEEARPGRTVEVRYTGWLENGTKFSSSRDRGEPLKFKLGSGRVIKGWEEGLSGMRVGGKRRLLVPAALGYGKQGVDNLIPPNANLVFEVELVAVL